MENKSEKKLTEREVFEQIVALQKQITENNANSLHRLGDVIGDVYSTEEDTGSEQVSEVCNVFAMREHNLRLMLEFYIKMYDDIRKTDEERKADSIKSTISELSSKIKSLELPDDKLPTLSEIMEATKELLTLQITK